MNLLVTGGAGFIGSHFVLRHVTAHPQDRVVVLDKLTYAGNKDFLTPAIKSIVFVQGDIADAALVRSIADEHHIDTVVNFAAESHVDNSIADVAPFLHTNVIGVQNLIDACRTKNIRLLHVSTDEVYGDLEDNDPPYRTEDVLTPSSPYAASKAAGEMLVIAAMRTYGLHACISRCTNNFGPHQADEKLIPTIIRAALRDQPVPLYAEGKNKRDWLFVTDHCDALEKILTTPWAFHDDSIGSGHIFNISADSERKNIDTAQAILDLLNKPYSLITFVADRPGHDWRYAVDSSAMHALGWKPTVTFEDGLRQTVDWYVRQYSA